MEPIKTFRTEPLIQKHLIIAASNNPVMKILAFTDIHGNMKFLERLRKKAKKADIIVCAGDFTVFGVKTKQILGKINKLGKKTFLINGNHEDEEEVEKACSRLSNIVFIHKKSYTYGDCTIVGYGGGGFSIRDADFERFTKKFIGRKNIILVTHPPPYGTELDMLWEHRGSKSIRDFIKKANPVLAINGHFHEHFGQESRLKSTILLNPGPYGKIIEI